MQEQEAFSIDMHATSGTFCFGAGGGGDGFRSTYDVVRGRLHVDSDDHDEEPPVEQEKPERQLPLERSPHCVGAVN